jgi:hypothetical protein
MASRLQANEVFVSPTVYEMMVIEVNNYHFQNTQFRYQIQDAAQKILRKGNFVGCRIQLRLSDLFDGQYTLTIEQEGEAVLCTKFSKNSDDARSIQRYHLNAV